MTNLKSYFLSNDCERGLTTLMDKFHEAYLRAEGPRQSLFDPVERYEFVECNRLGLFHILERIVTSKRTSQSQRTEKQIIRQRRRVVSLLHQVLFFRNEVRFFITSNLYPESFASMPRFQAM